MSDRLDLVATGRRPAAILNTRRVGEILARAAAAGLAGVPGDALGEDGRGRLAANRTETQVYVARTREAALRLRDLDRAVRNADRPEVPVESHALGTALGYPDCCAWAYPHTAFERAGEGEDVRWARNFVWRAGPGRVGPWSPWLNFHAARVFGLDFFEHLPCCPWCRPTQERNQTLVAALYDPERAAQVRALMTRSVVLWPDGRFLPFRCTGMEDGVLGVAAAGRCLGGRGVKLHFRDRILDAVPGLSGATDDMDGLRMGRRGWDARLGGRWRNLRSGKNGEPIVLAFRD